VAYGRRDGVDEIASLVEEVIAEHRLEVRHA
jgi:hypothetical protein